MYFKIAVVLISINSAICNEVDIFKDTIIDFMECSISINPSNCLEEKTVRKTRETNIVWQEELGITDENVTERLGKAMENDRDEELGVLKLENQNIRSEIQNKELGGGRGVMDEFGNLLVFTTSEILSPLIEDKSDVLEAEESGKEAFAVEGRIFIFSHKKFYLQLAFLHPSS